MPDPSVTFPGATNYLATSHNIAVTGDLQVDADFSISELTTMGGISTDDWLNEAFGSDRGFVLWLHSTVNGGSFRFQYSVVDGSLASVNSLAHGISVDQRNTVTVTRNATSGAIEFYVNGGFVSSHGGTAGPLFMNRPCGIGVANRKAVSPFLGTIYSAQIRDGIGGPIVADFEAADVPL